MVALMFMEGTNNYTCIIVHYITIVVSKDNLITIGKQIRYKKERRQREVKVICVTLQERIRSGLKPLYMLHGFGKVHSASYNNSNVTDYQLNFIAQRRQRSLITLSMQADNLRLVINK